MTSNKKWVKDAIDAKTYLISEGIFLFELDQPLQELIMADYPMLTPFSFLSQANLPTWLFTVCVTLMT
ncbi:hypothetical protein ScFU29_01190 [Streptococcus canis]|nr:hypothetical protein ScFU29_01190 [Streptococcus canis]